MSGSAADGTTALTDAERVDVRRFCGYPSYGAGASGFQSWRFFTAYGSLEFRLTNMSAGELTVVRRYLGDLLAIEQSIPAAATNLDTDEAAVWKHNRNEVGDRMRLLDNWRRRLAAFIGVPPGPNLFTIAAIVI